MFSSLRRHVRLFAVLVTAATAAIVGVATPAYAGVWSNQDGFENSPASTWWIEGAGDFGGFDGLPHTGNRYATIYTDDGGWSAVGRMVRLTPALSHRSSCGAQVWLQEKPGVRVNIEIIDPSDWTYIALRQVTMPAGYPWTAYSVGPWTPGPVDVVFRVSVLSDGGYARMKVDDLTVTCSYF